MIRVIAGIAVATAQSSLGQPLWNDANRWICRTDRMHMCQADSCTNEHGQAIFQIDFSNGEFRPAGSEREFIERITRKGTFDTLGYAQIGLDSGDSMQFSLKPEPSLAGERAIERKFSFSRGSYPEIASYFGICFPND